MHLSTPRTLKAVLHSIPPSVTTRMNQLEPTLPSSVKNTLAIKFVKSCRTNLSTFRREVGISSLISRRGWRLGSRGRSMRKRGKRRRNMEETKGLKREKKKMVTFLHCSHTTNGSYTIISSSPHYSPSDRPSHYKLAMCSIDKVS